MNEIGHDTSERERRNQEYNAYKDFQKKGYQRDPDPCKELKNKIEFFKALVAMRSQWDMRWPHPKYPGGRHKDVIAEDLELIKN